MARLTLRVPRSQPYIHAYVPYTGAAHSSYPFYVPLINPQSVGGAAEPTRAVLFQRVQDGSRSTPLEANWVVPVVSRKASTVPCGEQDDAIHTMIDPYRNEIMVWPHRLLTHQIPAAGTPEPGGDRRGF